MPSGERQFGQSTLEPAYNDQTGSIVYLLTPDNASFPSKANGRATAPLYLGGGGMSRVFVADETRLLRSSVLFLPPCLPQSRSELGRPVVHHDDGIRSDQLRDKQMSAVRRHVI